MLLPKPLSTNAEPPPSLSARSGCAAAAGTDPRPRPPHGAKRARAAPGPAGWSCSPQRGVKWGLTVDLLTGTGRGGLIADLLSGAERAEGSRRRSPQPGGQGGLAAPTRETRKGKGSSPASCSTRIIPALPPNSRSSGRVTQPCLPKQHMELKSPNPGFKSRSIPTLDKSSCSAIS